MVKARGWSRRDYFPGQWTLPSPNMPSFSTALVYPGAVLLEGTNLSEGRGTTRPFELVGAPFIDPFRLAGELQRLKLPGVRFVPMFFKPEFSKHAGRVCGGVLVQVTDRENFRSFRTYYELIRLAARLHPEAFHWQEPPYEFEYLRPPMDMICAADAIRKAIDKNIPFSAHPGRHRTRDPRLRRGRAAVPPLPMIVIPFADILAPGNFKKISDCLHADGVIAYPTDTLYGLGGNFFSAAAMARVDALKKRGDLPYSVAVGSLAMLESLAAEIPDIFRSRLKKLLPGKFTFLFKPASGHRSSSFKE